MKRLRVFNNQVELVPHSDFVVPHPLLQVAAGLTIVSTTEWHGGGGPILGRTSHPHFSITFSLLSTVKNPATLLEVGIVRKVAASQVEHIGVRVRDESSGFDRIFVAQSGPFEDHGWPEVVACQEIGPAFHFAHWLEWKPFRVETSEEKE